MTAASLFAPDGPGATALFLDTSGLVPLFTTATGRQHEQVSAFFEALRENELPYSPIYTNQYVLDELVSLLLSRANPATADAALRRVRDSNVIQVLDVTPSTFERAVTAFHDYDDRAFSLTDHVVAVQAGDRDVSHVLTYDEDFRSLGFSVLPRN